VRGPGALAAALLAALGAGCPGEAPPDPAAPTDAERRAACELLISTTTALQSRDPALLALVEAAGGEQAAACLAEHPTEPTRCMSPQQAEAFLRSRGGLVEECLGWSDALRGCLLRGDLESPGCAAAYARSQGLVSSAPQRNGPAPRWSLRLEEPLQALVTRPGGQVIGLTPRAALGLAEGRQTWRTELGAEAAGWLLDAGGGWLVTGTRDGALLGLDDLTGRQRFRASLPDGAWAVEAARFGARVLLLRSDGRLSWLSPDRCASPGAGCLESWDVPGAGPLQSVQPLHAGPGGLHLVTADERLRALEPTGRVLFELEARRSLGEVSLLSGGHLALVVDGQVAVLQPPLCRSQGPLRLGLPPQPADGSPDLDVEHAPPPGCVVSLVEVPGLAAFAPAPLGGDGLALVAGLRVLRLDRRTERWRTEVLPVSGPLASPAGQLFVLCRGARPDAALRLRALSASTGLSLWLAETPFPAEAAGAGDRPLLVLDGDRLVVGLGPHLAVWELAAAPAEGGTP